MSPLAEIAIRKPRQQQETKRVQGGAKGLQAGRGQC